jgi:hypothetical protein
LESGAVVVATVTWVRSSSDAAMLERSIAALACLACPIAVADRGNSPAFVRALQRIPGVRVVVPTGGGLVAQVHAALELAQNLGASRLLYTEPDKESFFRNCMRSFLDRASACNASVVIASRSAESFETYPAMQRYTESVFNQLCGDLLKMPGDYCYGPFLMSRAVAQGACRLAPALSWGWRPAAFRIGQQCGPGIQHIIDDYPCPPDHRREDEHERIHRVRQLSENLRGLIGNR